MRGPGLRYETPTCYSLVTSFESRHKNERREKKCMWIRFNVFSIPIHNVHPFQGPDSVTPRIVFIISRILIHGSRM